MGKPIIITYSTISKYDVESFSLYLKQGSHSEKLFTFKKSDGELFDSANSIQFSIPNESNLIGTEAYVEAYIKDENGAYTRKESSKFTIEQNTEVPKVFTPYKDVFTQQYNNYPSDTRQHETDNYVKKAILDENGLVHLLVEQIAWWWGKDSRGHTTYNNRNWRYYYMTYNPKTGAKSTPIIMFENQMIDNGNLPPERYSDFIMSGDTLIMITSNSNSNQVKKYELNGSSVSTSTLLTGSDFDSYSLVNYKNKTYLTYRHRSGSSENWRPKAKEIYPSLGGDFNIVNHYYGSSLTIKNEIVSFYAKGITFKLDSDMRAIESTKYSISGTDNYLENYLRGDIKIYDSNVKEMYIDNDEKLFLLKSDNSKEQLFHLDDSDIANSGKGQQRIEAAVYQDRVMVVHELAPNSQQYKVVIYNRQTKRSGSTIIGNKIYGFGEVYSNVDLNSKKQIVIANPDGKYDSYAQLITADLADGFGLEAPTVHIDTEVRIVKVNESMTINWSMEKESSKLDHFKVYKVVNGVTTLLDTINNTSTREYTYRQNSSNENIISLKVMAFTNDGESSSDQITLRVTKPLQIISFTVDKNVIDLDEPLKFSWEVIEGYNNLYKGYKKCSDDMDWSEIFETDAKTKIYAVNDFSGVCQFKITSGESERILSDSVQIDGKVYQFKENSFTPTGEYTVNGGLIDFSWETEFDENVEFDLFIKKLGESSLKKVTSTMSRMYQLDANMGNTFQWQVSFEYDGKTVSSPIMNVTLKSLDKPTILEGNFTYKNGKPTITLKMSDLPSSEEYEVFRSQYTNQFRSIGTTTSITFEDENIKSNESYSYYVVTNKNGVQSVPSNTKIVDTNYNENYDVIIDSDNYQIVSGRSMTINYHPSKQVNFEQYEIRVGTKADEVYFYTLTDKRTITIEGLEFNQNYFVEIYPTSPSGKWVATQPAKLTFSTGFDSRNIIAKAIISIDEVATDHVSFSWDSIPNADKYTVLRSENGEEYESLGIVEETAFTDGINLVEGAKYRYKVKAFNGGSFTVSDESNEVVPVPVSVVDTDRDGIPDDVDLDDDNDGISDLDEIKYGLDSLDASDAEVDSDGDGVSNLDEIKAGTNLTDKNDYPQSKMSNEQKALFMLLLNRSIELNKDNVESSGQNSNQHMSIPALLMIESLQQKEEK
ncbi:MAG TPA: hypothetical protein ENK76_03855 [Campylobacterales bacterium]|nr:hypothetical protein [Campylobacterales bacterium]